MDEMIVNINWENLGQYEDRGRERKEKEQKARRDLFFKSPLQHRDIFLPAIDSLA